MLSTTIKVLIYGHTCARSRYHWSDVLRFTPYTYSCHQNVTAFNLDSIPLQWKATPKQSGAHLASDHWAAGWPHTGFWINKAPRNISSGSWRWMLNTVLRQPLWQGHANDVRIDYFVSLKHFGRSLIERDTWAVNCFWGRGLIKADGFWFLFFFVTHMIQV